MLSAPQPTRLASVEKLEYKRWSWQERGLLFPDLTFHSSFSKSLPEGVVSTVTNKATAIQESQRPEHPLQSFFLPQRSLGATPPPHQAPQCGEKSGLRPALRDGVRLGDWLRVRMKAGIRVQLATRLAVLLWSWLWTRDSSKVRSSAGAATGRSLACGQNPHLVQTRKKSRNPAFPVLPSLPWLPLAAPGTLPSRGI